VFFSNSGAEANECAIKTARKYAAEHKGSDCYTILTLVNSFHGRTVTTLAATGQDTFHRQFLPLTDGFVYAPANEFDALKATAETHNLAAVMVECVQGEGGVLPLDLIYLQQVAQYCKEHDILLIVDEVQTGNGRTGTLYAYMQYGLSPDVVSTAKGIGGGLPLGATLLGEKVENVLGFGDHGSTFGGNPVSSAGALSVLSRMDDAFLAEVRRKSRLIFETLEGKKGIKSVSGLGLMIGIETEKPAAEVVARAMEMGVLCLTAKHKVRLLPALNIPMEVLAEAVEVIKQACKVTQEETVC
jgi:acetylornithine/N-succinyldiaminopimelate aminotransferase